jgi:ferredoxin-NADP reductase
MKLTKKTEISDKYLLFEFESLEQKVEFIPGQFFSLTLINPPYTDNRGNSRYFGFTNLPGQNNIQMLMKKGVSAFKKSLQEIPIGSECEIDKINGKNEITNDTLTPIIFIALGIGIAPIISLIKFIITQKPNLTSTLIYINNETSIPPFMEELEILSRESDNFKLITGSQINEDLINSATQKPTEFRYIVRGEAKDVIQASHMLNNLGVDSGKISSEIFTGY